MDGIDTLENSNSLGTTPSYPPFIPISLYGELIKIKQTMLLLYTGVLTYLILSWPSINVITLVWLNFSLFFTISGATLFNMYIDRDIDAQMERTKKRALPSGQIRPSTVLKHAFIFNGGGFLAAGIFINWMTGLVIFLGLFFDVIVYSIWLKRRTRYSIIFGGIAGGLPAIAGYTAATGTINVIAILFGLFVVAWIPLHILTLALLPENLEGYKNANIPMWPVTNSKNQTMRVIAISGLINAIVAIFISILLQIHFSTLILVSIFVSCLVILSFKNLKQPSDATTFIIFKGASMIMVTAFFLWFIGMII
ncbi:MAG: protoheme IX farnesyltransferase [Promethearchaeota archaeon]